MRVNGRERGATLPIVALILPVLILMTAFAVDLGRQRSSRRTMQARADIVSLDLVRLADGRSEWAILNGTGADPIYVGTGGYAQYLAASAARNDVDVSKLVVVWGTWTEPSGFVSCGTPPGTPPPQSSTTCYPNAVEVTASETTDYFFQPGTGGATRTAIASKDQRATLRLGSFAARVQSGQSPLLSPILNDAIGATAGGYDGLADSDLPLDHVVPFLPEFSGGVGTPDEVLDTDVYLGDFLLASADALRNDPDATGADLANAEVLEAIHADVDGQAQFRLGDLVGAEQGSEEAALQGDVNLLDLVAGSILLANGENAIAMPPPTVAIPGVLQVNTPCDSSPANDATEVCSALTVIERPVTFTGRPGASANTKQLALRNGISGGLVPLLDLAQTQVNLKAATGLAEIAAINCGDPRAVTALITTGLLETTVRVTGLITVDLFLTSITVPIVMTATRPPSSSFESVTFTEQPDGSFSPPNYEAGSQDLGLGNLTFTTTIGSTNSSVTAAVQTIVNGTVTPFLVGTLLPLIEQRLVIPVLKSLGANVSGADLAALAVGCNDLMLVG